MTTPNPIATVRELHQPANVRAAAEAGDPPDCRAGCGAWPCATWEAAASRLDESGA